MLRRNRKMLARIVVAAALSALWGCDIDVSRGPDPNPKTATASAPRIAVQQERVQQGRVTQQRTHAPESAVDVAPPPPAPATAPLPARGARIGTVPEDLIARRLTMPVPGIQARSLTPQFYDARGERGHEALDIMAAKGLPVVAVEDGTIAKLFLSKAGGITIYQFDPAEKYTYYYAHLDRYADGLAEGDKVKRGQTIGFVGQTGNARTPHLHFGIFLLGPEKRWWKGEPLDPYPALAQR
jgi:murein DD-endopeptidase MepM/ murein hydrolase activator NlpD